MIWNSITKLADNIIGEPIKQWAKRSTLKLEHKNELEVLIQQKQIELIKNGQQQDYDLDRISLQNMQNSWKDEIVLIIFLTPVVLAFVPGYDKYIQSGFNAISQMPDWYVAIVIGMVVVIYGMRGLLKAWLRKPNIKINGEVNKNA